ncbi:MAG: PD-(D/E)XK nuclease family protein [Candidatus Heimdallarchaeum endolithica]|uniref:PD-(D/E)XK nuclease family protein n=1 Tax=Candidatus Heimdallarchaeum endolithica TaxID=2876572 RepID=A0A9Y1BP37_9ARCH|nr:MAG: PD-(D/E)XK nuclease family protein [Candidatus Heimdallarchaeum endolithica]
MFQKHVSISVTDVLEDDFCTIRPYIAVLLKMNKLREYASSSRSMELGTFYHLLLQSVLSNNFDLVQHFYIHEKLSVKESFFTALYELTERFFFPDGEKDFDCIIEREKEVKFDDKLYFNLRTLAMLCSTLVEENNKGRLISLVIGTEYKIEYELSEKFLLTGRIDIVAWTVDRTAIRVIELKTGKKSPRDKRQVLTYSEIIRKKKPNIEITPELWYLNNNDEKKRIILDIPKEDIELKRISSIISFVEKLKSEKQLSPRIKNKKYCNKKCRMCEYIDEFFVQNKTMPKKDEIVWKKIRLKQEK